MMSLIFQSACKPEPVDPFRAASSPAVSGAVHKLQTTDIVAGEMLEFSIQEGGIDNTFIRSGPVAAHIVQSSGSEPRFIVAFAAGNSGVGLWFKPAEQAVKWLPPAQIRPLKHVTADGLELYGIRARIAVKAESLLVERAVLGSVRLLRNAVAPSLVQQQPNYLLSADGRQVMWQREREDGKSRYLLKISMQKGSIGQSRDGGLVISAAAHGLIEADVLALSGDSPLHPIPMGELFTAQAGEDELSRRVLAFLSYKEKLLAGSWRFLTYFGRDTLLSTRLLMPVLTPVTIEAALGSVLNRVDNNGEVAHEEDIADLAVIRNLVEQNRISAEPLFNYHMIDDDFMLAPVVAEYFRRQSDGHIASFLARESNNGQTYGTRLAANFNFVLNAAERFAGDPVASKLIALKPGEPAGNWRDSREGLAKGRFAYDVNVVFVAAALNAIADLLQRGVLDNKDSEKLVRKARTMAITWENEAPGLFQITLPYQEAVEKIRDYGSSLGVPVEQSIASLDGQAVTFNGVALDESGKPIPVMHSDGGFALLFGKPNEAQLRQILTAMTRSFPAGLMTPVGLLVSNPVYADNAIRSLVTRSTYHGTVVWPWHHALFAAGLSRQLRRSELSPGVRRDLHTAEQSLWQLIEANRDNRTSELWSWSYENGRYVVTPFGQHSEHETESNAAQLWSTVFLGIPRPVVGYSPVKPIRHGEIR